MKPMDRIIITQPILGIYNMQVCAHKDVLEEEILEYCQKHNPSGTKNGWTSISYEENQCPVKCNDNPDRIHYILIC